MTGTEFASFAVKISPRFPGISNVTSTGGFLRYEST